MKLLYKAKKSIAAGKAREAVASLDQVSRLFPDTPESDEAERLLAKIGSLEVLLDRSHEWRGEMHTVSRYLRSAGIGVTISDASLEHMKDRLVEYEMILIWQQSPAVTFTDAEIVLLKKWLKKGGRLLVIGTTQPQGTYPLRKLLASLGCPLRGPEAHVNYGKGKVKFFDNTGLFDAARLGDARESRQEVIEVFRKILPYEQLARSVMDEHVPPEKEEMVGRVKLRYAARLATSAAKTTDLVKKIVTQIELVYKDELPKGITLQVLPRAYSGWLGGVVFSPGAMQPPADIARELARAVALYGLFPEGKWISYPPWVTHGWCDLVALRTCYKIGFKREAEAARRVYMDAYKLDTTSPNPIDLSVSRRGRGHDYIGKAQWVLETLEKRHGKNLLARLRKTLKRYAAAGRISDAMSTRNVIFYLSQTLHVNMFDYFHAIGTTVLPMKLDYYELEKARKSK